MCALGARHARVSIWSEEPRDYDPWAQSVLPATELACSPPHAKALRAMFGGLPQAFKRAPGAGGRLRPRPLLGDDAPTSPAMRGPSRAFKTVCAPRIGLPSLPLQ